MPQFSAGVVCSAQDKAIAGRQAPHIEIAIVDNGAEPGYFVPNPQPDPDPTVLLLGTMNYPPNIDAALYFFRAVWPRIRVHVPDLRVVVVGHLPPPEVVALGKLPGVTVTGSVPDVRPFLKRAWIMAVPLRMGGGTRLKIIEAMMSKLPVVSTSIGAEGLAVDDERHLLLADPEESLAAACVRLLQNQALRLELAESAYCLALERYNWQSLGRRYAEFCHEIASNHRSAGRAARR
jgi:glycosyltransferase involved in cell wall biosynthesis